MATDDRGRAILVAYWTPFAFALILIGARLVSRIWFVHFVGLDDWAAILAMVIPRSFFSPGTKTEKIFRVPLLALQFLVP